MTQPAISFDRILVCNDDGINAPGIALLEEIARGLSEDVWVVAPESEQSGAGHSLTLTVPVRYRRIDDKRFAVSGTPTDCVMMAVNHIMQDHRPTLLLSGVNRGANMAEDVTYSGTIAAAMEGTLAGVPSIALSQAVRPGRRTDWECPRAHAAQLIRDTVAVGWDPDILINMNFPAQQPADVKGVRVTEQGRRDLSGTVIDARTDPRGFDYYWFRLSRDIGKPGHETDLKTVRDGWISVTPLHLDLTHYQTGQRLAHSLDQRFEK